MRLYSASSLRQYYAYLKRFLTEFIGGAPFSVFVPEEDEGVFYLEYCAPFELHSFHRKLVVSRELAEIIQGGKDHEFTDSEIVKVAAAGRELPIHYVKVIWLSDKVLGIMAFHGPLSTESKEWLGGGGGYIFHHICSALELVREREKIQVNLEQSNTRLDAIGEIGAALGQLDIEVLLAHLIGVFTRVTSAQVGSIVLESLLTKDVEWGLTRLVLDRIRRRQGPSLREMALATKEPVFVRDYAGNPDYEPIADYVVESFLCVPLVSQGTVLGTVNLVNSERASGQFTEMDRDVVATISSLAATALENSILHRELLHQERIKTSLQIASRIQRGMYPQEIPKIPGYDMAWMTSSCDETGGDYFDCAMMRDGRLLLAIGDVSGHGIGAALIMAASRAHLRALLSLQMDLRQVMERLNDLLTADMDPDRFMTMFLMYLDCREHRLGYVNAGHDRPLIYSPLKSEVIELESTGIPLGMMSGATYELAKEQVLLPGDSVLLTTDGISESNTASGELFGRQRLRAAFMESAVARAQDMVNKIAEQVELYGQGGAYRDDKTLAVLKRCE